ncbi:MAG: sulfatase-like hydrolase/transferase [Myxococcota bacterium]
MWWMLACRDPVEPATGALAFDGGAPRNLLMISIDTLRRDHVDRYATDGVTRMEFLSARLAEGVALDDHQQCANWTFHSVTCTLLGRQVEELGWVAKLAGDGPSPLPGERPMLARRLRDAGFRTALASPMSWIASEWNNTQGYTLDLPSGVDTLSVVRGGTEGLRESLDAEPADRWFLHLHVSEPHATYSPPEAYRDELDALPPAPWDLDDHDTHYDVTKDQWPSMTPEEQALLEKHLRVRYTGETRWLDDELETAWAELDAGGWLDDTLVVFWTDHGEQFWEHGAQTHAYGLNAEENDGIAGFWARGLAPVAWGGPTHAIDLAPTILDALGLPVPADGTLPGAVVGTAPADRPRFTSTAARWGPAAAVTVDGLKLVYAFDGTLRAFDRRVDRAERTDVYDAQDPRFDALWAELRPRAELLAGAIPEVEPTWP